MLHNQWRSQTKYLGRAKCLILSEQQYFVWISLLKTQYE